MKNKFFIVLSILGFLLTACDDKNSNETRTYDDYLDRYITLNDFYQKDGKYGIYVFGKYCHWCDVIKTDVFNYADSLKNEKRKLDNFYFFEFKSQKVEEGIKQRAEFKVKPSNWEKKREELVHEMVSNHASSVSETYFMATPAIYIIENKVLVDYVDGSKSIPNYLKTH